MLAKKTPYLRPDFLILGGGISGNCLAWLLQRTRKYSVVVLERGQNSGGLAGQVEHDGESFDIGSHRIHPGYDTRALKMLRELLGDSLIERPRRGLVRIQGKFLDYPPSAWTVLKGVTHNRLVLALGQLFFSQIKMAVLGPNESSFTEYTKSAVGNELYNLFFQPYAKKLWNIPPEEVSFEPARGRVKKLSLMNQLRSVLRKNPVKKFYYPKEGFSQISKVLANQFILMGGNSFHSTEVKTILIESGQNNRGRIRCVEADQNGEKIAFEPANVISTLPIHSFSKLLGNPVALTSRGLRLLYLTVGPIEVPNHETFYFPECDFSFGRVSVPQLYSTKWARKDGRVYLAIEFPCSPGDKYWEMSECELVDQAKRDLVRAGILSNLSIPVHAATSVQINDVYPILNRPWRRVAETYFDQCAGIENLFLLGRSALFLHINADHAIAMACDLFEHLLSSKGSREWRMRYAKYSELSLHD